MTLPFTHEQFLDVFGRYNNALWPFAVVLWLATLVSVVRLLRGRDAHGVGMSALLAVHWIWAGIAYHLCYFRAINPAAAVFGLLFVLQGGVFLWRGVAKRELTCTVDRSVWARLGLVLIAYALAYPVINLAAGMRYPRVPTFGVPCPTGILTAGVLLLVPARAARWAAPVPLLWSVVGGSAAVLLSMRADLALGAAGVLLLVFVAKRPGRSRPPTRKLWKQP